MVLAVLLVSSMAVPAAAETASHPGETSGYTHRWTLTMEETSSMAKMEASPKPTTVSAALVCQFYYDLTGQRFVSKENKTTGYAVATVMDNNIISINHVPVRAQITAAAGSFWLGNQHIVQNYYLGAWRNNLPEEEQP